MSQSTTSERQQRLSSCLDEQSLPQSRLKLLRKVESLTNQKSVVTPNDSISFIPLKREKKASIGKILVNIQQELEMFAPRESNVKRKVQSNDNSRMPMEDLNYEGHSVDSRVRDYSSQVSQFAYLSLIDCQKFSSSISKQTAQKPLGIKTLSLSHPQMAKLEEAPPSKSPQKLIQPHQLINKRALPPLVKLLPQQIELQNHKPKLNLEGKLVCGRIASGVSEQKLEFYEQQKILSLTKVQLSKKPNSHNLAIQKVNRVKSFGAGNVLGKALQDLNRAKHQKYVGQSSMVRDHIKEKEKQIDELIFGKSYNQAYITEQQISMQKIP